MTDSLKQKSAFVTGGSRGIGAAIVRKLAHDGASVAFTYHGSQDKAAALVAQIEAQGGRALALQADSANVDSLRVAIDNAARAHEGIDILVNSAGLLLRGAVDQFSQEDFDRMLAVNVRAPFFAVQAALPHMRAGGRVILIGSVVAERAIFPGASVYALTKGALASMTRGLARDLGPRGIGVVNVQPGPTITDMSGGHDAAVAAQLGAMMPLGRMGQPEEIAGFVAYLASPAATLITGASLSIDGGYLS